MGMPVFAFPIDKYSRSCKLNIVYYNIHLPVNLETVFTYSSQNAISSGCRVLVNFNRKDMIGICGARVDAPSGVRCKAVLEILDEEPVVPVFLMDLAFWMSAYYRVSVGICLFAMLPSLLIPDLEASIRRKEGSNVTNPDLAQALADGLWHAFSDLRKALPKSSLLKLIETAETDGEIEIDRHIKHRDKPRYANFVIQEPNQEMPADLAARQSEAMTLLSSHGGEMTMASLSQTFSYSVIKALAAKGLIKITPRRVDAPPVYEEYPLAPKEIKLTQEQIQALDIISQTHGRFAVNLLYGVTGSGKTEIYIHVMRRYLQEGKNILFLIPEISLTPQMVERFSCEFGSILAINHSKLSISERLRQWRMIFAGEKRIVVGARSAIFAPLPNLGLVIVDEEHEQSYKQENQPRYHGRDMAIVRAQQASAQVILGSATPALESWFNQLQGKYRLQRLEKRPYEVTLPEVQIVDMRNEESEGQLSHLLMEAIESRLRLKQQVILFHNRRGYSSYLQCQKCGNTVKCPSCDISMYYHRDQEILSCHYCGYSIPSLRKCPSCNAFSFSYGSPGTQKLEHTIRILFPEARVLRLDSDSARREDAHKKMYKGMKSRNIDILLGTQMITKGLDFPGVTLVGIVLADISLNIPDFRSAERTFQHLTQVSGRSGRGKDSGQVIIQTYNPDHYAIRCAANHDYESFMADELGHRKSVYYPPFCKMGRMLMTSASEALIKEQMQALEDAINSIPAFKDTPGLVLLGPAPAPFPKIGALFRAHLVIKAPSPAALKQAIELILKSYKPASGLRIQIDTDPVSLM